MIKTQPADLHTYLKTNVQTLKRLLRRGDDVHAIRVTIRRIRAAIRFVELEGHQSFYRRRLKRLKNVSRTAGLQRELEVALGDTAHFDLNDRKVRLKLMAAQTQTRTLLQKKRYRRLATDLEWILENGKITKRSFQKRAAKIERRLGGWQVHRPKSQTEFHRFRIDIKRTRYVLEFLGRPVAPLRKIQTELGRAHDLAVLQDVAGKKSAIRDAEVRYYRKAERDVPVALQFAKSELRKITNMKRSRN